MSAETIQPKSSSEQHLPEYADVTPEMVERARVTGKAILETQQRMEEYDAERGIGNPWSYVPPHMAAPNAVERLQKFNPGHDMDAYKRVTRMIDDAKEEDKYRETIKTEGKSEHPTPKSLNIHGKILQEGGKSMGAWTVGFREGGSRYSKDKDGNVSVKRVEVAEELGKGEQKVSVVKREFKPENQERARELIKQLAEKRALRALAHRRKLAVEFAERQVENRNSPSERKAA